MQAAFSVKYNFITVSMSSFKSRKISSAQYGKLHLSVLDYWNIRKKQQKKNMVIQSKKMCLVDFSSFHSTCQH